MAVVFEGGGKTKPIYGPILTLDLPPPKRSAGWEREIAPSVLKEVEVCPTFQSDDAHTIGLPPRITQPSVARYVREVKHYRDASYGSHFGLYSGVNMLPVFGERMKTVPTVPRTHHHFGTGVNAGFQDVELHPSVQEIKLIAERATWIPSPSEASATMQKLATPTLRYPQEHQALFPFPKDPSGARCPSDPSPATQAATATVGSKATEEDLVVPISSVMWRKPFWYDGALARATRPVGNPNEYAFGHLPQEGANPIGLREAVELDKPDYYIPGRIRGRDDEAPGPEKAEEVNREEPPAARVRRPLYERRVIPFRPPKQHYQLSPWIGQDRAALAKVGEAFRAPVCQEHYSRYPPGEQLAIPHRRCDYPDLKLSAL